VAAHIRPAQRRNPEVTEGVRRSRRDRHPVPSFGWVRARAAPPLPVDRWSSWQSCGPNGVTGASGRRPPLGRSPRRTRS